MITGMPTLSAAVPVQLREPLRPFSVWECRSADRSQQARHKEAQHRLEGLEVGGRRSEHADRELEGDLPGQHSSRAAGRVVEGRGAESRDRDADCRVEAGEELPVEGDDPIGV